MTSLCIINYPVLSHGSRRKTRFSACEPLVTYLSSISEWPYFLYFCLKSTLYTVMCHSVVEMSLEKHVVEQVHHCKNCTQSAHRNHRGYTASLGDITLWGHCCVCGASSTEMASCGTWQSVADLLALNSQPIALERMLTLPTCVLCKALRSFLGLRNTRQHSALCLDPF